MDIIFGAHSILAAMKNPQRGYKKLYSTEKGLEAFFKNHSVSKKITVEKEILDNNEFQNIAHEKCKAISSDFKRVPGQVFLETTPLKTFSLGEFLATKDLSKAKFLCLDGVTDAHNRAAIMRTASFFGIDAVLIGQKNPFSVSPSTYRIASGAFEYTPVVISVSVVKIIKQLKENGIHIIGLTEHAEKELESKEVTFEKGCLVVGAEDEGLSNAVKRIIDYSVALKAAGELETLNVSIATALALQKLVKI